MLAMERTAKLSFGICGFGRIRCRFPLDERLSIPLRQYHWLFVEIAAIWTPARLDRAMAEARRAEWDAKRAEARANQVDTAGELDRGASGKVSTLHHSA